MKPIVSVDASGCWPWPGSHDHRGYGRVSLGRFRKVMAHRLAYELAVGPIPDGMELDHLCRNKRCVNPAHLEPVTHIENVRRSAAAENAAKTHCVRGHLLADHAYLYRGRRVCRPCGRIKSRARYATPTPAEAAA